MIRGQKDEVLKVKDFVTDGNNPFSFEKIYPCPPKLRSESAPNRNTQSSEFNTSKYGAKDWYEWCVDNWGTKWDSSETELLTELLDEDTLQITWSYQTAWAPPIGVYEKLAEMFPNINIFVNFDESGMGFSGWKYYKDGAVEKEEDYGSSYYSIKTFMEPDTDIWDWLD